MVDERTGWRSTLWVMVIVQMMMMIGINMAYPLLPLFLEDDLGLARGHGVEFWAGLIGGAHFVTMAVFSPIWGNLADRYGRKPMVLRSTAAVGLFSLLVTLVQSPFQLLGLRLCMGMLSGYLTASTALVGSVVPRDRLGYALGLLGTGELLGVVIGPIFGGVVSTYLGYRMAFFSTGLIALSCCLLVAAVVREDFVPPTAQERAARPGLVAIVASLARSSTLMPMLVVLVLTRATINGVGPVTSLYVREIGVSDALVPTIAGLAFSLTGLGAALSAPILGRLADRVGSRIVLIAALAGSAVFYLPQAFVSVAGQFLALRFAVGLLQGGVIPAANALIGRLAPPGRQSATYGLMSSATSFGSFTGPLLSGGIAAWLGLRSVFVWTAVLAAINVAWVAMKIRDPSRGRYQGSTLEVS